MSCEGNPRGLICLSCPEGKSDHVQKIIRAKESAGHINEPAGEIWLKANRGRTSTPQEEILDYKQAFIKELIEVCKKLG